MILKLLLNTQTMGIFMKILNNAIQVKTLNWVYRQIINRITTILYASEIILFQ